MPFSRRMADGWRSLGEAEMQATFTISHSGTTSSPQRLRYNSQQLAVWARQCGRPMDVNWYSPNGTIQDNETAANTGRKGSLAFPRP